MSDRTWYEILQVNPSASEEEIKAAYRARAWTPAGAASQEELRLLNEAYAVLSNPGRRAEYDLSLAEGTPARPRPSAPSPQPALTADEEIAQGPLLLRLWGRITNAFWQIFQARYYFIPLSWMLSAVLIGAGIFLMSEWEVAVRDPNPTATSIPAVIRNVPDDRYVTVTAAADHEVGYTATGNMTEYYYVLYDGPNVIFAKGFKTDQGPQFTGRLRGFDAELLKMVRDDSKGSFWEGVNLLTTHYLDTTYRPVSPALYSSGVFLIALVLLTMLAAWLRRYTVFVAADLGPGDAAVLTAPLPAHAAGKFRDAEGASGGFFQVATPVLVAPNPEPGTGVTIVTYVQKRRTERRYEIAIAPGSEVRTGFDHTGGTTRPALAIKTGGQTVYLRLRTMAEARAVARAIAG